MLRKKTDKATVKPDDSKKPAAKADANKKHNAKKDAKAVVPKAAVPKAISTFSYAGPMRKVFWEDPYQHTLRTKVAAVNGNEVVFTSTVAYSFSGGQASDIATVNGLPVLDSRMPKDAPQVIYYTMPENHGLKVGDDVLMKIDWENRYRLMRLHFTAEIILEVVTKLLGFKKMGANIVATGARIDFECAANISQHFERILAEYNTIIAADKPIIKAFSDEKAQRRYWQIDGFAQVPCGGTHVETTSEVGYVRLQREKQGTAKKPMERIQITLADDGTEEYKKQTADAPKRRPAFLSTMFQELQTDAKIGDLISGYEIDPDRGVGFKTALK